MAKIIGIGNALVDILVHLSDEKVLNELNLVKGGMTLIDENALARIKERFARETIHQATGGSASNTIHALATLGTPTGFVGAVGDDELGRFYADQMIRRGTEACLTVHPELSTGVAATFMTPDGERTFATFLGAAARVEADGLQQLLAQQSDAAILHIEGYLVQDHDLILGILRTAKDAGLRVSYDLASWNIVREDHDFIYDLVRDYVDIVFANEEEATAFSGESDPNISLQHLGEITDIAVVKVGKRGAQAQQWIGDHVEFAFAPGLTRQVVDTTAAGDFFAAGFLHGLVNGHKLRTCLQLGNSIASEVIQVVGTQVTAEQLRKSCKNVLNTTHY